MVLQMGPPPTDVRTNDLQPVGFLLFTMAINNFHAIYKAVMKIEWHLRFSTDSRFDRVFYIVNPDQLLKYYMSPFIKPQNSQKYLQ